MMNLQNADRRSETVSPDDAVREDLIVRLRKPLLRYFTRRTRMREDAEDLTQEVFMRLSGRENLQTIGNLEGFVFSIAANLLTDFYRRGPERSGMRSISLQDLNIAATEPDPCQIAEDRQNLNDLLCVIKALPARQRAAFVMHRFEMMSHAEIASALGISVSTVEKHIAAAVVRLVARSGSRRDV